MLWFILIVLLSVVSSGLSINRPVYKIVLKQKGYAQFLQYDLETPPLREFTICTWIRIYDLIGDQSIFTYVANGNNRVVRLWLDSGGKHINVSINGQVSSSPVDITKDVWRHICLSYQSDFGAWALYVDSRLLSCQASQSLQGFILPGGGSVIIGYGTADGGAPNGLEGEIFGTNMILASTIERNYTIRSDPFYEQKSFHKNKMKSSSTNVNYIILNDLQTGELKNTFETTELPTTTPITVNATKSFIKFRTPHSFIDHAVGIEFSSRKPSLLQMANDFTKQIMELSVTNKPEKTEGVDFWNLNNNEHTGRYTIKFADNGPSTNGPLTLSEFETPPPVPRFTSLFDKTLSMGTIFPGTKFKVTTEPVKTLIPKQYSEELSEIETPPPVEKNVKVYGQWTSSKFAGNVLNYLKNIQQRSREQKKVPQTIPLTKISDSFPYASDFKITKIRPPFQFQRRNLVEKQFETSKRSPQINVQIFEDDLRSNIIKAHAQTRPKNVEITNRGVRKKKQEHRFYRNVDSQGSTENFGSTEYISSPKPFSSVYKAKTKNTADLTLQNNNLLSILPFLKSLEYFVENSDYVDREKQEEKSEMYTRSLANGNKWHNVKSYNNDYTPRQVKLDTENGQSALEQKIAQANIKHPSIRLNYKHEDRNFIPYKDDPALVKNRALATEVSNQSENNKDSVSILKYNHGFLPGHNKKLKMADKVHGTTKVKTHGNNLRNNFNKQVKIGNALNERHVIGVNAEQNKQSFVGGNENIPDINKYRSDLDNIDATIPGSLGPRVCKNVDLLDRVLYVQPDESIDMTHIVSPVRQKNSGIEFVMQNYKKCSLAESDLQDNPMLFIDWSRTPVRLFGGSFPKTTTDLCGFFK